MILTKQVYLLHYYLQALDEIVCVLFKVHILHNNSANVGGDLLVGEVALVVGLHPGELVLALGAAPVLGVLVLAQLAHLVTSVAAVVTIERVEDSDVLLELSL